MPVPPWRIGSKRRLSHRRRRLGFRTLPAGRAYGAGEAAWEVYKDIVPEEEYPELYTAILALDGMVRAGSAMSRDGAVLDDPAHGADAVRAHPSSLVYKRLSTTWETWAERLELKDRLSLETEGDPLGNFDPW